MREQFAVPIRLALTTAIILLVGWVYELPFSPRIDLLLIVCGPLLIFPHILLGRAMLDRDHERRNTASITTFVQCGVGICLAVPIARAIATHMYWPGPQLPIPAFIGAVLSALSGIAFLLTVMNLALKGLGAPFFIVLSRRLATDWLYSRTRNPMVLTGLIGLPSLGLWFRSGLFILWALLVVTPPFLFFVKMYEERELELRFGASYLEYKSKTPMLFPMRRNART